MKGQETVSLVIPVYNEGGQIGDTISRGIKILVEHADTWEVVVIDDGSTDNTWEVVASQCLRDERIRGIRFTRNFGKEAAILAGLKFSSGDAVIVMDGDMQHPPEIIGEMIALWKNGFPVVHAVKEKRQEESLPRRIFGDIFYGCMKILSGFDIKDNTDFKLLDRRVVGEYLSLPEKIRFFRGLIPWLGYKGATITFSPGLRISGHSKWTPLGLMRLGFRALFSFSAIPMQLVTALGGITFIGSLVLGIYTFLMKMAGRAVPGFSTVIILILLVGSIIMMSLGIMGQYVAMIYEEVKARPPYIVEATRNIDFHRHG